MTDILTFISLIPGFFCLFVLGYVFAQRRKTRVNRAFILFFSTVFVLMLLEFAVSFPIHGMLAAVFIKVSVALFLLLGIQFLNFLYAATGRRPDACLWVMLAVAVGCCTVSFFTDAVILKPAARGFSLVCTPGPAFGPLALFADLIPGVYAMILCHRGMRLLPEEHQRRQMSLLFYGTVASCVLGIVTLGAGSLLIGAEIPIRLSGLGILVQAIFVFRAVTRYHFLSVDIGQIEEVSRVMFDHVREGVVLLDGRGLPVQMNMAARRILSVEGQETAQLNLGGIFSGYSPEEMYEERRITVRMDSQERILLVSQYPISHPQSTIGKIVLLRDITGQTRLEEELSKARQLESLGILAGGIAHDFNNFLTSITATFGLVKVSVADNPELVEIVSDGETAALKAAKLTQQLVTFAKGGVPIKESVPVRTLIEETVRFSLRGSSVSFNLDMADGVWPVNADREQLSQVFHNLAINAVQAMPRGGVIGIVVRNRTLAMSERPPLSPGDYVEIHIRDSGTGIAPEIMAKIFDPYFTTKKAGSGLGLTTVYSIMKRHGGHIFVASKIGLGTEMTLFIPASATAPVAAVRNAPLPKIKGGGTLLIMDDEPTVLSSLAKMLENLGFTVDRAVNGEEAVRLYDSPGRGCGYYRAVIADLTVPGGLGGKELAQKLLAREPGLRIIVSSGYSSDPILSNFSDFGFCGTLKKPYDMDGLSETLGRALM